MRFHFTISHVPGTYLAIAGTLSHSPADEPIIYAHADKVLLEEAYTFVNTVMGNLPASEQHLEEIKKHQRADEACQLIATYCQQMKHAN